MKRTAGTWAVAIILKCPLLEVFLRMDAHGLGLATAGALVGWWANQKDPPKDPGACQCHCSCLGPERDSNGTIWWGVWIVVGLLIVINSGLVLSLLIKRSDSSAGEPGFSFKVGFRKGKYGATRGLQIVDQ